ncbi:MAG: hypothetical protein ACYDBQ_08595 [Thermoplasmatota archaeon]
MIKDLLDPGGEFATTVVHHIEVVRAAILQEVSQRDAKQTTPISIELLGHKIEPMIEKRLGTHKGSGKPATTIQELLAGMVRSDYLAKETRKAPGLGKMHEVYVKGKAWSSSLWPVVECYVKWGQA